MSRQTQTSLALDLDTRRPEHYPFPYISRLKDIPGGKALPNPRGHINKNPRAYNTIPAILAGPHVANPGTLGPNDLSPLTLN